MPDVSTFGFFGLNVDVLLSKSYSSSVFGVYRVCGMPSSASDSTHQGGTVVRRALVQCVKLEPGEMNTVRSKYDVVTY